MVVELVVASVADSAAVMVADSVVAWVAVLVVGYRHFPIYMKVVEFYITYFVT
jgi:hypothetical protein